MAAGPHPDLTGLFWAKLSFSQILAQKSPVRSAQLGFPRAGDDAGVPGVGKRHDANGFSPQVRMDLLLDGGKKAVKVGIKPFDLCRASHGSPPWGKRLEQIENKRVNR